MKKILRYIFILLQAMTILSGCNNNSINKTESTIAETENSSSYETQITALSEKATEAETEKVTEPFIVEFTPDVWQTAYADYIESNYEPQESLTFSLILLDNDDIPELFISTPAEASGEIVITYNNGNLQTCQLSRKGSRFIEKSGLIYSDNGHMWYFPVTITKLENGEFTVIGSGLDEYSLDENQNPIHKYTWENEKVSEEEFENNIDKLFDREKGIRPACVFTCEKMLQLLKTGACTSNGKQYELPSRRCIFVE